jgi:hypothetical protein
MRLAVAGLCEAGGSRWPGVTDPRLHHRERMPEPVGARPVSGATPRLANKIAAWTKYPWTPCNTS